MDKEEIGKSIVYYIISRDDKVLKTYSLTFAQYMVPAKVIISVEDRIDEIFVHINKTDKPDSYYINNISWLMLKALEPPVLQPQYVYAPYIPLVLK